MYNRIYILFNDKHLIYPLDFGFRQKWNIDCDIFLTYKKHWHCWTQYYFIKGWILWLVCSCKGMV